MRCRCAPVTMCITLLLLLIFREVTFHSRVIGACSATCDHGHDCIVRVRTTTPTTTTNVVSCSLLYGPDCLKRGGYVWCSTFIGDTYYIFFSPGFRIHQVRRGLDLVKYVLQSVREMIARRAQNRHCSGCPRGNNPCGGPNAVSLPRRQGSRCLG